ncbi:MAG: GGDEF domain-containing protein [Legionellaceae bacterium]|nr:GGDEF domain-containing protein [Legionellaceae bacterium]
MEEPKKRWVYISYCLATIRPLSVIAIAFACLSFAGYFLGKTYLYRPIAHGAATHPLTASCIILLGLALYNYQKTNVSVWLQRLFSLLVLFIATASISDNLCNRHIADMITPFQDVVLQEISAEKHNSMGMNTAIFMWICALAITLYSIHHEKLSQFFAFLALAIPMVSYVGYSYDLEKFHGEMSLLTATATLPLVFAILALTANKGVLKALLSPYIGGKIARYQILAGITIPILVGDIVVFAVVSSQNNLFGLFVVGICWFIIAMVSISALLIETVDEGRRNYENKLKYAAKHDDLTDLYNRNAFFDATNHEISQVKHKKTQAWALMVDIDDFKNINDLAGHATGDKVLMTISHILRRCTRKTDLIARLGGDEFAIFLTNIERDEIGHIAETIRSRIEKMVVNGWTETHGPITVSVGCAPASGNISIEQLLKEADEAMYHAKDAEKNKVSFVNR